MIELRHLHTFVAIADLRHFARAADRCNLSQPAVSHQMRILETALGARLINRAGRQVSLTVAGELFLEDARRIIAAVDRARERVQGIASGAVGRVRLGATESAGLYRLPPLLERYRHAHERFAVHFTIAPALDLLQRVAANELDMAVVTGRPPLGELRARKIGTDDVGLIAPAASPHAKRRRLKAAELREERWILREEGSDTRHQLDAWLKRHRLTPVQVMTLQGPDAVKRAVIAGLGIAVLSRVVVADEVRSGRLVSLSLETPLPARDVLLVDHPHKHHGAACSAMITALTE